MSDTVLLINPPIHDFAAYDLFSKPLGLLYLAARLRRLGYNVRLIDTLDRRSAPLVARHGPPKLKPNGTGKYHREPIDRPACLAHIPRHYSRHGLPIDILADLLARERDNHRPAAVLVTSMMTYWYPAVRETITLVRRTMPGIPIALGGVYATLMPEHARQVCKPDVLFPGSAFGPLLQWLVELTGKQNTITSDEDPFTAWPAPAYDLYPHLDYLTMITSLGCPFRCDYCASGILQPHLQQLSPESFTSQLLELLPLVTLHGGRHNIALMDDALLAHADEHIVPILRRIAQLNLPLRFHCPNGLHPRFISPQVAELMFANNFQMVRLSYESAHPGSTAQGASDGKITDRLFRRAVDYLADAGFHRPDLQAYILTGLPGQSLAEIEHSASAVHDLGIQVRLCQYSPIPGSKLFDRACCDADLPTDQPLLHNNTLLPAVEPGLSPARFQQFKHRINEMNQSLAP